MIAGFLLKKNTKRKFFMLKVHDPREVIQIHTQKERSSVMVITKLKNRIKAYFFSFLFLS